MTFNAPTGIRPCPDSHKHLARKGRHRPEFITACKLLKSGALVRLHRVETGERSYAVVETTNAVTGDYKHFGTVIRHHGDQYRAEMLDPDCVVIGDLGRCTHTIQTNEPRGVDAQDSRVVYLVEPLDPAVPSVP